MRESTLVWGQHPGNQNINKDMKFMGLNGLERIIEVGLDIPQRFHGARRIDGMLPLLALVDPVSTFCKVLPEVPTRLLRFLAPDLLWHVVPEEVKWRVWVAKTRLAGACYSSYSPSYSS